MREYSSIMLQNMYEYSYIWGNVIISVCIGLMAKMNKETKWDNFMTQQRGDEK